MNIQAIIHRERAPFLKALEQASKSHDKRTADIEKAVAAARAKYEADVAKANLSVAQSEETVKVARENLKKFDTGVETSLKTEAQPSKKNGAAKATPLKALPAKRGPKAKASAAPTPAKKSTSKAAPSNRAIKGRDEVRNGMRPPVKDAIRLILGTTTMRSRDITAELIARGWKPQSGNLASYVPYVLSNGSKTHDNKGHKLNPVFESVNTGEGRGFYRVRASAPPMNPKTLAAFGGSKAAKATAQAAASAPKKTAAPKKAAAAPKKAATKGGPRACSVKGCGVLGHNRRGHAKYVKEQKAAAKAAANGKAPHTNGKTTHATKNVAKAVAAATKKVAKAAAPKAPKAKAAPAKATDRPRAGQQKCSVCQTLGHNKKGHPAFLAQQAGGTAPKAATAPKATKPATPATPKAAAKKTETKAAAAPEPTAAAAPEPKAPTPVASTEPTLRVRTSDQIIAEEDAKAEGGGVDKTIQEGMAAFGVEA